MKKFLFILLMLFFIPFVNADNEVLSTSSTNLFIVTNIPNEVDQNTTREWRIQVYNTTSVLTSGLTCYFDVYAESVNGSLIHSNISSAFSGSSIIATVPSTKFQDKGVYSFRAFCNTTNQAGLYSKLFYVTKDGDKPARENFQIFIFLMFIIGLGGLFYSLMSTFMKLMSFEVGLNDVLISTSFYLLTIIVIFLSENYLILTFVETLSRNFMRATLWTNIVFPFLAFMISLVYGLAHKLPQGDSY